MNWIVGDRMKLLVLGRSIALIAAFSLLAACGGAGTSGTGAPAKPAETAKPAAVTGTASPAGAPATAAAPKIDPKTLRGTVAVDGSSTVFPISEAMAEEFQKLAGGNVRV